MKRNSSTPADGDYLGQLKFKGENDADQEVVYAKVTGKISDASDTTEDGLLEFALRKAGSNNIGARLTSTEFKLINGTGLEVAGLTYPTSDGTNGQVLTTNGSGTLSFADAAGGASSLNDLSDVKTFGTDSIMIGDTATGTINAANYNTGVGVDIFTALTEGDNNSAFGNQALKFLTTGSNNSAYGAEACDNNTSGSNNTGIGKEALESNETGSQCTAVGAEALQNNTGNDNTGVGYRALEGVTSGIQNVGVGRNAGSTNTTANNLTAIGYYAQGGAASGNEVTALGSQSLYANTGAANTAVGYAALFDNTSGQYSTAVGHGALENHTTGGSDVAVGMQSLDSVTTGASNTAIGRLSGQTITTGFGNTFLGYGTTSFAANSNYNIVLGYNCKAQRDYNSLTFGSSTGSDRVYNYFDSNASWSRVSDERYKEEIVDNNDCGLDFINDLRPVTFKWKAKADIDNTLPDYDAEKTERHYDEKMYGLIAQEVKQAMDNHNITDFGGWSIEEDSGIQGISQEMFVHPLIKAVQELSAKCDALQARINILEGK